MPPLATANDLEDAVLTRLHLLNQRISGVRRVFKTPPDTTPADEDFPFCYGLTGGTITPSLLSAGANNLIRNFVIRLLVKPLKQGVDDAAGGSEAYLLAYPFLGRFRLFYGARPNL